MQALHIFKPGRHTAMSGQTLQFSDADLQASANAYNPTLHEAPLVVGHPSTDDPAYGWIKSLSFDNGLHATPQQVNPAFAELVNAGAFKKISASFYSPESPANPVPGVYYLRHVGFLGAHAPAIKGLRSPSFADNEQGVLTFSEWDDETNASLWRRMREWLIGKFGQAEADAVVPGYEVKNLEEAASNALQQAQTNAQNLSSIPAFAEPKPLENLMPNPQTTEIESENASLKQQLAAANNQLATAALEKRRIQAHAASVAFCESIPTNKLPGDHRTMAVAMMDHLALQQTPLEFGEGENKAPLLDKFKEFLQSLPERVSFGEHATKARATDPAAQTLNFAAPAGFTVDPDSGAVHQQALAYQKTHGGSYLDAAKAVSAV